MEHHLPVLKPTWLPTYDLYDLEIFEVPLLFMLHNNHVIENRQFDLWCVYMIAMRCFLSSFVPLSAGIRQDVVMAGYQIRISRSGGR